MSLLLPPKECGATFGPGAVEILLTKVGANTRLLVEEVRKLATYVNAGETMPIGKRIEIERSQVETIRTGLFPKAVRAAKRKAAAKKPAKKSSAKAKRR